MVEWSFANYVVVGSSPVAIQLALHKKEAVH